MCRCDRHTHTQPCVLWGSPGLCVFWTKTGTRQPLVPNLPLGVGETNELLPTPTVLMGEICLQINTYRRAGVQRS